MKRPFIIAGPCSAESLAQLRETALTLSRLGVAFFRAGSWKPRTHPDDFEGYGTEALGWLSQVQSEFQLPTATEVASAAHVEAVLKAGLKGIWVGARTTVNPFAVQEIASAVAGTELQVFVKNPVNPDPALWMGALERFQKAGVVNPIAVHRGFSVYKCGGYRNAPIWMVPIEVKRSMPHIPILCDPSHIAGDSRWVPSLAQKAMDLCFDGLMIEVHPHPQEALSDAQQQLTPLQFERLVNDLVLRSPDAPNQKLKNKLEDLRAQIDLYDDHIVDALAQRMRIVAEIGSIKREGGITIFQPRRWEELIARIRQQGDMSGVSSLFLEELFALIHQEAVERQQGIMGEDVRYESKEEVRYESKEGIRYESKEGVCHIRDEVVHSVSDEGVRSVSTEGVCSVCREGVRYESREEVRSESKEEVCSADKSCTRPIFCSIDRISEHLYGKRAVLLVDRKVDELYGNRLPPFPGIVVEAIELRKRLETVQEIVGKLMTLEVDRGTWLVGIGGGVVCDITGFVASIYMRGVPFVLVPTTLLAQADASIGGKNGVNVNGIKNMAGCITQPQMILCDQSLLHTLPQREIRSGLGEVIKHALTGPPMLLEFIENHVQSLLALEPEPIAHLLSASHRFKCEVVERDKREEGLRNILNFGHTIGHAIEAVQQHHPATLCTPNHEAYTNAATMYAPNHEAYTHGEAVAVGMLYAVALSEHYTNVSRALLPRLKRLYAQFSLPTTLPCSLETLCDVMLLDKKRTDASIRFILLKEVGFPCQYDIPIKELIKSLYSCKL